MMTELETYLHKGRSRLRMLAADPRCRTGATVLLYAGAGLAMSAASLGNASMPLAMGLICAVTGWRALAMCLGSIGGYWLFWGSAGYQAMVWAGLGCLTALFLGKRRVTAQVPLLLPAISALVVSATGLLFQVAWADDTSVPIYLLRVALAAGSTGLFALVVQRRDPMADWLAEGAAVLALAQIVPIPYLGLGYLAAGLIAVGDAFPAAALAGLALDLSGVTMVPMTAVLTAAYLARLVPVGQRWLRYSAPGIAYLLIMGLCGVWDPAPLPGLILGGAAAVLLPSRPALHHRRGETGMAQVRLELMAGVLGQTQQLLLEQEGPPIDEAALLCRTRERACGGCPNRKLCRDLQIPEDMLAKPLTDTASLPFPCRKPGRMLLELRRSQEQLRSLRGDRQRQREYREAVVQQYQFLGEYLRRTADALASRGKPPRQRFTPEVAVCSAGKESANGDRCAWFSGTECRYYILLCDGMGTGLGAAQEGNRAGKILKQMLTAGFPAAHALQTMNSLLALRGAAGAVTVDLAEIRLDTGHAVLYKWGAAPSYLLTRGRAEKIGTATPPPGLSVESHGETVEKLSLRRGEVLILLSDGVEVGEDLHLESLSPDLPPGELAGKILKDGCGTGEDDATAAVIRLTPMLSPG